MFIIIVLGWGGNKDVYYYSPGLGGGDNKDVY